MSIASPTVGATVATQPVRASPPMNGTCSVDLTLRDGWTAKVVVGDGQLHAQSALNGTVLTQAHWLKWLSRPLLWVEQAQRQDCMKTSATTTVCRVRLPFEDGRHVEVVCKRGRPRHLRRRLLSIFRTSRPMRTWRRAHALLSRQIATARPLAVVERRRFGLLVDSLIFTEFLPQAVNLENLLTTHMRGLDNRQAYRIKSRVSDVLVAFLLQLQAAGLYHRDLKALNVIVQYDRESGDPPRICLVDLDGIKRSWTARDGGWKHMFMRLNVSVDAFRRVHRTDRLRLLNTFLDRAGLPITWRQAWHELDALSERKRQIQSRHQERSFRKYGRF